MSQARREPIIVERTIPFRRQEVFAAWSEADSLARFMCPEGVLRADAEVDFRVGGSFRVVMHGESESWSHRGVFVDIDPPRRLVFTWVSEFLPAAEAQTRVSVDFQDTGDGATRIVLVHEELPDTGAYDGHAQGWTAILAALDDALAAQANQ